MLPAVRLFNRNSGHIARRCEHEVWMIDPIFAAVCHSDYERLKRGGAQELPDSLFHHQRNNTFSIK